MYFCCEIFEAVKILNFSSINVTKAISNRHQFIKICKTFHKISPFVHVFGLNQIKLIANTTESNWDLGLAVIKLNFLAEQGISCTLTLFFLNKVVQELYFLQLMPTKTTEEEDIYDRPRDHDYKIFEFIK